MVQSPTSSPPRRVSRIFDIGHIGQDDTAVTLEADEAERQALATSNGLVRVGSLWADLRLCREGRTGVHVTGSVQAHVTQTCVVSLDEFDTDMTEPVDLHFLPEREVEARVAETARLASKHPEAEAVEEDLPDPIVNGKIDLGALMAEFLALGLDPYPRKPDAAFVEPRPESEEPQVSPFAALSRLKTQPPH